MPTYLEDITTAFQNIGGQGTLAAVYEEVRRIRKPPHPESFEAIIRREIENASSDSDVFQGRADLFYSVEGIGAGVWGLRVPPDGANAFAEGNGSVSPEGQRRQQMWADLLGAGGPDNVEPQLLRSLGIYGGASGVWYDLARTKAADPAGVTVGVLHTGRHYADDLTAERILYHYPRTGRPAGRDSTEIAATKTAASLGLPIFVIGPSQQASKRDVRRGMILGQHDSLEIFDVALEFPFAWEPGMKSKAGSATVSKPKSSFRPYVRADEEHASAQRDPFTIDPDKVDRGLKGHARVQNALSDWLEDRGIKSETPNGSPNCDISWTMGNRRFVGEVKSLTKTNVSQQLRLGLGQVLDYSEMLAGTAMQIVPVLAVEFRPPADRWLTLCDRLGVAVVWPGAFERLKSFE